MTKRIILFIIFLYSFIIACSEPVFRYALTNWRPESYNLFVFYESKLDLNDSTLVRYTIDEARTGRLSVLNVKLINLSDGKYEKMLVDHIDYNKLPYCVLSYPGYRNDILPIWSGEFSKENVEKILYSPARKEISRRILDGDAGVWLVVDDKNKKSISTISKLMKLFRIQNKSKLLNLLDKYLKQINETFKCPAPSVNGEDYDPNDSVSVKFTTLHLDKNNPEEEIFLKMLTRLNNKTINQEGEFVFPIFGRGRTLPVIDGESINKEKIYDVAKFLTGPCACIVKAENPGVDILFTVSWVNRKTNYEVFAIIEDVPLAGIGNIENNEVLKNNKHNNITIKRDYKLMTLKDWVLLIVTCMLLIVIFISICISVLKKTKGEK